MEHSDRRVADCEPGFGYLIFLAGIASGAMFAVWFLIGFKLVPERGPVDLKYVDLVTILLTGIAVILTALGLFLGVLALLGYSQFQKMTRAASAEHLEKMLRAGKFREEIENLIIKHVSSQLADGQLRSILAERVDRMLLDDASNRAAQTETTGDEKKFEG